MTLNFILVDDNKIDLFVNEKTIEKAHDNSKIKSFSNAVSAINYLKLLECNARCQSIFAPDIIFLDINMPLLNGFQFIREFNRLNIKKKERIKIYILSSSTNIEDVQNAKKQRSCIGFINKPLTQEVVEKIVLQNKPYLTIYDHEEHGVNL